MQKKVSKLFTLGILVIMAIMFAGCASKSDRGNKWLPHSTEVTTNWRTYDKAVENYNKIKVGMTAQECAKFGVYEGANNVKVKNWLAVSKDIKHSQATYGEFSKLDDGIQLFFDAVGDKKALEVNTTVRYNDREGSFWADTFGFKRINRITGFDFHGLILFVDDVVVYVFRAEGGPVNKVHDGVKPLGPAQDVPEEVAPKFLGRPLLY